MHSFKKTSAIAGFIVLLSSFIVFINSVEPTGSLWDCGEFILGAYKLQVVHPPGAGLFILVGRLFAILGEMFSDDPSTIAYAVNLMSALCTSFAGAFVAWITMDFGKLSLVGRHAEPTKNDNIALGIAGIVAGLATTFASSIWFSAVEGEVYAMSTMFTALTFWTATRFYVSENNATAHRWLLMSLFSAGLSIGVHLLSLLTLPAIALLVYFRNYKQHNIKGILASMGAGVLTIAFVQKFIIVGIPALWKNLDIFMVNNLGMPFHSGLVPTLLLVTALIYFLLKYAHKSNNQILQFGVLGALFITIGFSTVATIVIRANADTPVNMNVPSDATRLLPYLNREQYGERPLIKGPHYDAEPQTVKKTPRYGRVGDKYQVIDEKYEYVYKPSDEIFFPRIGHTEQGRPDLHKLWRRALNGDDKGRPSFGYNLQFLAKYQIGWMYVRYFMWNFVGRQNGEQGYFPWDIKSGHWLSGIQAIDESRLYNMDLLPDTMKYHQAFNTYYFLPFLFGIIGLIFHYRREKKDFFTLLILFIITGIGIIIYSNQPPNEPRERDYVLVGSFMTFCIWIGLGALAIYQMLKEKTKNVSLGLALSTIALSAPIIMAFQNFDDHSRKDHYAARDYASNFLNSVRPNAIIFTYGDNDTYPLWYAQEVEGIRRDVRVVNLSLIAVDWYIAKLRSKVNDSAPLKLTLSDDDYRGNKRNQIFIANPYGGDTNTPMNVYEALRFIKDPKNIVQGQNYIPSRSFFLPINKEKYLSLGFEEKIDSSEWVDAIQINLPDGQGYFTKDDLAVMDVVASNFYERPIYFAITCQTSKLLGMNNHFEMEGLALKLSPTGVTTRSQLPSIYGYGDINLDMTTDNIMNKWKWGNFDKKRLYVDQSYMAELQAMKLVMLRTAIEYDRKNEYEKSAAMAIKYFEVFPHMNFPYDQGIMPFINVLVNAKAYDDVKKHIRILAEEMEQYVKFYESQTDDQVFESFKEDYMVKLSTINDILSVSKEVKDPDFEKEMNDKLKGYIPQQTKN